MVAIAMVTAWSVGTNADGMTSLVTSGILTGPAGVRDRLAIVTERLHARPVDNWARRSPGIGGLTRYVYECTASTDHLFVTWFAPQVLLPVRASVRWRPGLPGARLARNARRSADVGRAAPAAARTDRPREHGLGVRAVTFQSWPSTCAVTIATSRFHQTGPRATACSSIRMCSPPARTICSTCRATVRAVSGSRSRS